MVEIARVKIIIRAQCANGNVDHFIRMPASWCAPRDAGQGENKEEDKQSQWNQEIIPNEKGSVYLCARILLVRSRCLLNLLGHGQPVSVGLLFPVYHCQAEDNQDCPGNQLPG